MVTRKPLLVTTVVLLLVSLFGLANPRVVQAAPSPGCDAVNAGALNGTNVLFPITTPTLAWTQGEVITAKFVNGALNDNTANLLLAIIGSPLVSSPPLLPGQSVTLSAVIASSTTGFIVVTGPLPFASITTTCTPVGGPSVVCFPDSRINRNCAAPVAVYFNKTDTGWHLNIL